MRIITHNIRYATTSPFPGEAPWPQRRPGLLAQLKYHTRHDPEALICLQEVLHGQLVDILDGLNDVAAATGTETRTRDPSRASTSDAGPALKYARNDERGGPAPNVDEEAAGRWKFYGVGRDDGVERGEYSPVFYRPRAWRKVAHGTMWLSQTPGVPGSKGWDAASVRICTVLVLERRGGEKVGDRRMGGPGGAFGCLGGMQSGGDEEEGFVVVGRVGGDGGSGSGGNGGQVASMGEEGWEAIAEKEGEGEEDKQWSQKKKPKQKQNSHGKRLLVMNTHLDDQGLTSRRKSANLILSSIPQLRTKWKVDGVVLAGDLNSEAADDKYSTSSSAHSDVHTAVAPSSSRETGAMDHDRRDEKEKMKGEESIRQLAWMMRKRSGNDMKDLLSLLRKLEDEGMFRNRPSKDAEDVLRLLLREKEEEDAWTILNAPGSGMRDIRSILLGDGGREQKTYGHSMTFTGFNGRGDSDGRCKRIDFIHVDTGVGTASLDKPDGRGETRENGDADTDADADSQQQTRKLARRQERDPEPEFGLEEKEKEKEEEGEEGEKTSSPWLIQGYAVLPNVFDDGVYISDHRAVVVDMVL